MPIREITPVEAQEMVENGKAIFVDVREKEEFDSERIPGAVHCPISVLDAQMLLDLAEEKDKALIFYCMRGRRSSKACSAVYELAASSSEEESMFYLLEGGILLWKDNDLDIEHGGQ